MGLKWFGFLGVFGAGGGGCVSWDVLAAVGSRNAFLVRDQGFFLAPELCGRVVDRRGSRFDPTMGEALFEDLEAALYSATPSVSCCCR